MSHPGCAGEPPIDRPAKEGCLIVTVIVILAMIFALLALRLYSVLGKRTGHEQRQMPAPVDDRPMAPAPAMRPSADSRTDPAGVVDSLISPSAQGGIRAVVAADRDFDVSRFVGGARSAYAMILEAFWRGDRDRLQQLCDTDVFQAFSAAIDEREAAGQVLDNRLVRIDSTRIIDASLNGSTASITVQFESDIAAVTRNAEGTVIAGSMEDAITAREAWTFTRDLRSAGPDWMLVATDEN